MMTNIPSEAMNKNSALAQLLQAICDAVATGGEHGVPGGTLYASLMAAGCSLQQFQTLMDLLVQMGRLRRKGHLYYTTTADR